MKDIKTILIIAAVILLFTNTSVSYARDFGKNRERKQPKALEISIGTSTLPLATSTPILATSTPLVATSTPATSTPVGGTIATPVASPLPKSGNYLSLHTAASANTYYQSSGFSTGTTRALLLMSAVSGLTGLGLIGMKKRTARQARTI